MTVSFPAGLNRSRSNSGKPTGRLRAYPIKNGKAKNFYKGTPVRLSNGTLDVATNTAAVLGVGQSYHWIDDTTNRPQYSDVFPTGTSNKGSFYNEGFTTPFALVDDDPHGTWIIKTDASVSGGELGTLARVTNAGTKSGAYNRDRCRSRHNWYCGFRW